MAARLTRTQDLHADWPNVHEGLGDDLDHVVTAVNRNVASTDAQIQALLARIVALETKVSQLT